MFKQSPKQATELNFAARAGRWSAGHWKTATFGWLGFVTLAILLGSAAGSRVLAASDSGDGESGRASHTLGHAGFRQPASETVLIQNHSLNARGARFGAVMVDVHSPLDSSTQSQGQISNDGHSAIVRFEITGKTATAKNRVAAALTAVAAAQRAHPDFIVQEAGDASADRALSKTLSNDFKRA